MKKSLLTLMAITVTLFLFGGCIIAIGDGDYTDPKFTTAPAAVNVAGTSFDVTAVLNEAGTIYVLVLADGATEPTRTEVKAGYSVTTTAGKIATISVTNLTAETAYDVYVLAEDDETSPNVQNSSTKLDVTTSALIDTTAPTFTVAPAATNIAATTLDITATIDEDGVIYAFAIPNDAVAPDADSVKAGTSAAATAGTVTTISLTGLIAGTAYDVYVVAEDDETTPNVQTTVTKVDVTTTTPTTGWLVVANGTAENDIKSLFMTTNTITMDNYVNDIYSVTNETMIGSNANLSIADLEPATYTVRLTSSNRDYNEAGEDKCVYDLYTTVTIVAGETNTLNLQGSFFTITNEDSEGLKMMYLYTEFDTNLYDAGFDWLNTVGDTDAEDIIAANDFEIFVYEIIAGAYTVIVKNNDADPDFQESFNNIVFKPGMNYLSYDGADITNYSD